ncbi:MAG: DUF350 domain-containing protein [Gammaproteobacteria bacterium]|nr:DUF350 domain-containing protein [Gammaproteobacteria bacterium]
MITPILNFLIYFLSAITCSLIFIVIYDWVTPYHEVQLIRKGNLSAVISLGGALIGFILPLASVIRSSIDLLDLTLWALVALLVQISMHLLIRVFIPDLKKFIDQDIPAPALWHSFCAISIGLINAACMS